MTIILGLLVLVIVGYLAILYLGFVGKYLFIALDILGSILLPIWEVIKKVLNRIDYFLDNLTKQR